jgi:hypothetical protein
LRDEATRSEPASEHGFKLKYEERDMATVTVKDQNEPDLDRLEQDAREKVRVAETVEAKLSLDALTDPACADELRDVRSERASAEAQLRQIEQAREEQGRREDEARERAEVERKQEAYDRARELQRDRESAGRRFDKAAAGLAQALAELHRIGGEQEALLATAGRRVAGMEIVTSVPVIEGALAYAYREAGVAPAKCPVPARSFSTRECRRVSEADARLIEPATK